MMKYENKFDGRGFNSHHLHQIVPLPGVYWDRRVWTVIWSLPSWNEVTAKTINADENLALAA